MKSDSPLPHIKLGFEIENKGQTPSLFKQVHGNKIIDLTEETFQSTAEADGGITHNTNEEIYCFSADCVPLLFYSTKPTHPIAAVHSGWRSSAKNIAQRAISHLAIPKDQLCVSIGPCILDCCFEVKSDLIGAFQSHGHDIKRYIHEQNRKLYFNLPNFIIKEQLTGVAQIDSTNARCTHCSTPTLPSYRRDGHTNTQIRSWIKRI